MARRCNAHQKIDCSFCERNEPFFPSNPGFCGENVGEKPDYLNWYQWDAIACKCKLSPGHQGKHDCLELEHR